MLAKHQVLPALSTKIHEFINFQNQITLMYFHNFNI